MLSSRSTKDSKDNHGVQAALMSGTGPVLCVADRLDPAACTDTRLLAAREARDEPPQPAQQLLVAIEAATTERQFASALADYRAPRNEGCSKRVQREWMPALRQLEGCRDLPGRNNICRWESGDQLKFVRFTEQQLCAYLRLCKITGELFKACIRNYRRIIQRGTIDQDKKSVVHAARHTRHQWHRPGPG